VRRRGVGNDACNAGSLSGGAACGQRHEAGRQGQSLDSGVGARTGAARSMEAAPAAPTGPEGGRGGGGGTAAIGIGRGSGNAVNYGSICFIYMGLDWI